MNDPWAYAAVVGLAFVTLFTRGVFLMPRREVPIPAWLQRALKVAPLAALTAVIVPEIVMTQGHLVQTWQDARLPAVLAATLYYRWRPGVLGPMLAGLALYLPLRIFLGW
jgi:branched-subunit amino acid transport protein